MGRAGLPPILKLEEVLDLMLDPAKYRKYMVEFKEMYDSTKAMLGLIDTKEQADIYLSNALTERNSAVKDRTDATELLTSARAEMERVTQELRVLRATINKEKEQVGKAFAKFDEDRATFAHHVSEVESQFVTRQSEFAQKRADLDRQLSEVAAKRAKLESALG